MLFRPTRWDYFYDEIGKAIIQLIRKLIKIRRENYEFRYGEHYFYNHYENYQSKNVLLFSRKYNDKFSLVALNFSDYSQDVPFSFPFDGNYLEKLHGNDEPHLNLKGIKNGVESTLTIPSNYGRIFTLDFLDEIKQERIEFWRI